jgi:hypothetical protein
LQLDTDTANVPEEKKFEAKQKIYREVLPQLTAKAEQEKRVTVKNENYNNAMTEKDPVKKKTMITQVRIEDLADVIKNKYNLEPTAPTE